MKNPGSSGNGQAPPAFGFKELLKDSFAKTNGNKDLSIDKAGAHNSFSFQKQNYSMKSLKNPQASLPGQSSRPEGQLMSIPLDSKSKNEKEVLSEIDSLIGESKPTVVPAKSPSTNSWGSGGFSASKPVFSENPKKSLTSKPPISSMKSSSQPSTGFGSHASAAPATSGNSTIVAEQAPPTSPSLTNFFAPVQQPSQQLHLGFGGEVSAVYRQDRDLCDVTTAREVWTSFEASKLFLEKQKNNAVLPPVEYKFAKLDDYQGNFHWSVNIEKFVKKMMRYLCFRPMQREITNALFMKKDVYYSAPEGVGRSLGYKIAGMFETGFTLILAPNFGTIEPQLLGMHETEMPYMHERLDSGSYFHPESLQHSTSQTTPDAILTSLKKMLAERKCTIKFQIMTPGKPTISESLKEVLKECHTYKMVQRIVIYDVQALSKLSNQYSAAYVDLVTNVVNVFKAMNPSPQLDAFGAQVTEAAQFPVPPMMAISSEASRFIREDTMDLLGMNNPQFFYHSFFKPNHRNIVVERKQAEVDQLAQILQENYKDLCGIVYVNTPRNCDTVHKGVAKVLNLGLVEGETFMPIEAYHTKMTLADRERVLDAWKRGAVKTLIVCVVGLPIKWHKQDIRFTIHFNLPKSLEIYYHQGGVAGRDGNLADSILLYTSRDIIAYEETTSHSHSNTNTLQQQGLASDPSGAHFESGWILSGNKFEFNELIRFAEEDTHCRKQLLCNVFGQLTKREDCRVHCDNCSANYVIKSTNHIEAVRTILRFYANVAPTENPFSQGASHHSKNPDLTLNQLCELLRGKLQAVPQKMKKASALNELLPQIPKKELSYLLTCLLRNGYLKTKMIGTINGSYQALTLDLQYFKFYRRTLEDKDANFTLRVQSKRRNNDAIEDYLTAVRHFETNLMKLGTSLGVTSDAIGSIALNYSQHLQSPLALCELSEIRYSLEMMFQQSAEEVYREIAEPEVPQKQLKPPSKPEAFEPMPTPKKTHLDKHTPIHKGVHEYLQSQIPPNEAGLITGFDQELDELLLADAVGKRTDKTPKQLQEIVSSVLPRGATSMKKEKLTEKIPVAPAKDRFGKCIQEELYRDLDTRLRTTVGTFNALEQKSKKPNQVIANLSNDSIHKLCLSLPIDFYNWDTCLGSFVAKSIPEELKHRILWEIRHFVFMHGIEGTGNSAQKLIQPAKRCQEDESTDILKEVDSMFRSESPTSQTVDLQEAYPFKPSSNSNKLDIGASQIDNELDDLINGELEAKMSSSVSKSASSRATNLPVKRPASVNFSNMFPSESVLDSLATPTRPTNPLNPVDRDYSTYLRCRKANLMAIENLVTSSFQKRKSSREPAALRKSEDSTKVDALFGDGPSKKKKGDHVSGSPEENKSKRESGELLGKRDPLPHLDANHLKESAGSPVDNLFGMSLFEGFGGILDGMSIQGEEQKEDAQEKVDEVKDIAFSTTTETSKDGDNAIPPEVPKKKTRKRKSEIDSLLQTQPEESRKAGDKKKKSLGKTKKSKTKTAAEDQADRLDEVSLESSERKEGDLLDEDNVKSESTSKIVPEQSPEKLSLISTQPADPKSPVPAVTIDLVDPSPPKAITTQTGFSPRKLITSKAVTPVQSPPSTKAKSSLHGSPKPFVSPLAGQTTNTNSTAGRSPGPPQMAAIETLNEHIGALFASGEPPAN